MFADEWTSRWVSSYEGLSIHCSGLRTCRLQQIKQQLRQRMHDPVPHTGEWLKSVVQGYFNYHAVPGNMDSLRVFRARVTRLWRRILLCRSQTHRLPAECMHSRNAGFPYRACSILIPSNASPPDIRDKSRMR